MTDIAIPATAADVPAPLKTEFLFDMQVGLSMQDFGNVPSGRLILFASRGGSFKGPRLQGEVLAHGGDWGHMRADGTLNLDVRLTLKTADGAAIYMTYGGRWAVPPELRAEAHDSVNGHQVDPALYYYRTTPLFETGSRELAWLNNTVAVASGYRLPGGGIGYKVFKVL